MPPRRGLAFAVAMVLAMAQAGAPSPGSAADEEAPINGLAYRAVQPPDGPDFAGVRLGAFQASNPTVAVYRATVAGRRVFADAEIPENFQVSRSGPTEGASRPVTDFSEVNVAIDPTNPEHLLGSSKFFHTPQSYGFYTGVFESFDGGRTWSQMQPPGVEDYRLTSDPVNTFDGDGNGYFTLLTRNRNYSGLDMLKKPAGRPWQRPVVVDSSTVTDKQWIAADQDPQGRSPYAGNLYMSWTDVGGNRIVMARSTNGNRTWRRFVVLASGPVQGSVPAVGPDGTVYVAWGRSIFGGPGPGRIEVRASRNGGASFGAVSTAAQITSIPYFLPNGVSGRNFRSPGSMPAFAVSPINGFLYAAWADYRHGDADIYVARSTDGVAGWGPPIRINDDPVENGMDQFHPQLAVAPNGRVAVMWMDRRLPCPDLDWIPPDHRGRENFCITTFIARSTDNGETWSPNVQAGARPWDWTVSLPTVSINNGFTTGFIGDYQGLASGPDYDYPFWAATTDLGDNPDHSQEVFVARVAADRDYQAAPTPTVTATPSPTATATAMPSPTPAPRRLLLPRLIQGAAALQ